MKRNFLLFLVFTVAITSCSAPHKVRRTAVQSVLGNPVFEQAHVGISVFNPSTGKSIYHHNADKFFVPASNTKIITCYVAMKHLDDTLRGIRYEVLNDSTVLIEGVGDPSMLHADYPDQPVLRFLSNYKNILISRPSFNMYLGNGWGWNDYLAAYSAPRSQLPLYGNVVQWRQAGHDVHAYPRMFADSIVTAAISEGGFEVHRPWGANKFALSTGKARERQIPYHPDDETISHLLQDTLQRIVTLTDQRPTDHRYLRSVPLDTMLAAMMHRSDNFFAEQTLLMVSEAVLGEVGDKKILHTLLQTDLSDIGARPTWADGSGLSRYNLFTPNNFVDVLRKMEQEFGFERIKRIFPTGGSGTLSTLYLQDSGFIYAKTGTLNGVVSLSGYLVTRKKQLLLFSVLVNHHRQSATDVRKGIEQFLTTLRKRL